VTAVLLIALLLRQGMPLLADSVDGGGDSVARERRYRDAGDSFTRRAYDADRVLAAGAADTAALTSTPLWDRATIPHTAPGSVGTLLAWQQGSGMPDAAVFNALRTPGLLPTWRAVPFEVTSASPLRSIAAGTGGALPPIVVSDGGRGYAIVSDPARYIAAPSVASTSARLAHAWNQQNPRLVFGEVPHPSPVLITVRDVRDRVSLLAPMLQGGSHVMPLVHEDSLLWVLDLYAASVSYPLSDHVLLHGTEVAAAQFAATALVNAHTGRVMLVPEQDPPLLARRPLERLARHLVPLASLPESLRRSLPPRADALKLEGAFAARFGSRAVQDDTAAFTRAGARFGDLALVNGAPADSSLGVDDVVPVWIPARRTFALTAAAIDARGVVQGVMLAPGGEDRRTRWRPSPRGTAYEGVLRGAQETSDSLRQPGSLTGARRGSTRVLPGSGAPRFLTPYFTLREGRPTQLAAVLLTDGVRRGVAVDVPEAAALTWREGGRPLAPGTAAASLYQRMRAALQRGAWSEFGASFEALGRVLGVPRDSGPR